MKIIYHKSDFDGIFCREIARRALPSAELIGWDYSDPAPEVGPDEPLIMLDISVDALMAHPRLVWIDHHKTAMEKYPASIPGYRIDGVAACRLAWQYFHSYTQPLPGKQEYIDRKVTEPLAVTLAGEWDIWDKRDPRAELFQHGLRSQDLTPIWPTLLNSGIPAEAAVRDLLTAGMALQYARTQENASVMKTHGFTVQFEGRTFIAANLARCNSLSFASAIGPEHEGCLAFGWNGRKWRCSLYGVPAHPEIDFTPIARKYGGGGHRQACGFETDRLPFLP